MNMAEGLLTQTTGSRKKSKQKTFDVFHQSPISGANISRAVPCVGPIDFAPPGCRKNRVSDGQNVTSDSDSSTKSGTGSSPFTPSSPTVCVTSQGVSQSTPAVPYSNNDHVSSIFFQTYPHVLEGLKIIGSCYLS